MLLEIMVVVFAAFAISRSFLRYKSGSESLLEFLLWVGVWVSIIIVVLFPKITARPAEFFGVGRGVDLLIYGALIFLIYSVYRIYAKIEKVEQDITKLTREIALRKK